MNPKEMLENWFRAQAIALPAVTTGTAEHDGHIFAAIPARDYCPDREHGVYVRVMSHNGNYPVWFGPLANIAEVANAGNYPDPVKPRPRAKATQNIAA